MPSTQRVADGEAEHHAAGLAAQLGHQSVLARFLKKARMAKSVARS